MEILKMDALRAELKGMIAEEIRKEIERRLSAGRYDIYKDAVSFANFFYALTDAGCQVWSDLYEAADAFEQDEYDWRGDYPVQQFLQLVEGGDVTDFHEPVTLNVHGNFEMWDRFDEVKEGVIAYLMDKGVVECEVEVFDGDEYTTLEVAHAGTAIDEVLEMARVVGDVFYIESVKVMGFDLITGGLS